MGLFEKRNKTNQKINTSQSEKIINQMLLNAEIYLNSGAPEKAFETYKHIVEISPNSTAQFNLGVLYAQGNGTKLDFLQASYWFLQAVLSGDHEAEKPLIKCTMDYLEQDISNITPYEIYQKMQRYTQLLYPKDKENQASDTLYTLASYHFNKEEYEKAAKLFRSAAEYYNHGESQNYIAVLYNAGAGVEKDDLASLYWFDRAVDNGISISKKDRNGILTSYFSNYSQNDFYEIMEVLIKACINGTPDIPQDHEKAKYWRNIREKLLKNNL